jgi:hypothetical protein
VHGAAREPAHLFEIAAAGEPADPNSGPTQFRHQLGQAPLGAGTPSPLRNLLHLKRHLCGHSLQPIITHLTVQPFQGEEPGPASDEFDPGALQFFQERQGTHSQF